MPLSTSVLVPVYEEVGRVNWWHVTEMSILTPEGGDLSVRVVLAAEQRDPDGRTVVARVPDRVVTLTGPVLMDAMGDAFKRARALRASVDTVDGSEDVRVKAPPGMALFAGMRDAVYAVLRQQGWIPGEAEPVAG